MIIVTGGEGFIGKNIVSELTNRGHNDVIVLDTKTQTLDYIHQFLSNNINNIDVIFHMGAIADTKLLDRNLFDEYNVAPSIFIWNLCSDNKIPLIYASSAATYGDGEFGFNDEEDIIKLKPLNPYGWSKQQFDVWAESQEKQPPFWCGLKFFNVYGYGEDHKGDMASVAFQLYNQLHTTGKIKLFKSHKSEYQNGGQLRDFIYIDDVVDVCLFMFEKQPSSGIYNVGTGKSRTFKDLAIATYKSYYNLYDEKYPTFFDAAKRINKLFEFKDVLSYFDIPKKIRDKYQYFTEANISKLRSCGYEKPFYELEMGVDKYVKKLKK